MIGTILSYTHYSILFIFGIVLSFKFSGISFNKKNSIPILLLMIGSGFLQVYFSYSFSEEVVWWVYPFIAHLPILLVLCLYLKKRFTTSIAAITSAYLCCQPANWFGEMALYLSNEPIVVTIIEIIVLVSSGLVFNKFSDSIAELYNKKTKDIIIFGIVPIVYYIYDYSMAIYTNYWLINNRVVIEFLPLFICIIYFVFCLVYYKQYESQADAQRNEQIMKVILSQQNKENQANKANEQKIRLLRHDLRLLLNNLVVSIENNDKDTSLKLISSYIDEIDSTTVKKYCSNDIINYVFSSYAEKCQKHHILFDVKINVDEITINELLLSSLLSNILDNAINAQLAMPQSQRKIYAMIKYSNEKMLLSVRNPYSKEPIFVGDIPVSSSKGHGFGTQSIQYFTKRLGGNCQFTVKDNFFIVRVVI